MIPAEILALHAGPALDKAVHRIVFGKDGRAPAYSTDDKVALTILDQLPLFLASIDPDKPGYSEESPFVAGRLQHEELVKGDITIVRVTGPTKALALCKAALIVLAKTGGPKKKTMEERISEQVAATRQRPASLRVQRAQPGAALGKKSGREPLPPRKPFIPGQVIPPPPGRPS
jgi:hypothetical protein